MDAPASFEANLRQLEKTVKALEGGDLGLDAALSQYEGGIRLLASCHAMLDAAGQKVAMLTGVTEAGEPETAEFDATATIEGASLATKANRAGGDPGDLNGLPF